MLWSPCFLIAISFSRLSYLCLLFFLILSIYKFALSCFLILAIDILAGERAFGIYCAPIPPTHTFFFFFWLGFCFSYLYLCCLTYWIGNHWAVGLGASYLGYGSAPNISTVAWAGLGHGTANCLLRTAATTVQKASRRRNPDLHGKDPRFEKGMIGTPSSDCIRITLGREGKHSNPRR